MTPPLNRQIRCGNLLSCATASSFMAHVPNLCRFQAAVVSVSHAAVGAFHALDALPLPLPPPPACSCHHSQPVGLTIVVALERMLLLLMLHSNCAAAAAMSHQAAWSRTCTERCCTAASSATLQTRRTPMVRAHLNHRLFCVVACAGMCAGFLCLELLTPPLSCMPGAAA